MVPLIYVSILIPWGRQKKPPKGVHAIITRTYDCAGLYGRRNFGGMSVEMADYPGSLGGLSLIIYILKYGEPFHARSEL